jgi:hypothetical protein
MNILKNIWFKIKNPSKLSMLNLQYTIKYRNLLSLIRDVEKLKLNISNLPAEIYFFNKDINFSFGHGIDHKSYDLYISQEDFMNSINDIGIETKNERFIKEYIRKEVENNNRFPPKNIKYLSYSCNIFPALKEYMGSTSKQFKTFLLLK